MCEIDKACFSVRETGCNATGEARIATAQVRFLVERMILMG
jgi:hypothetical protein